MPFVLTSNMGKINKVLNQIKSNQRAQTLNQIKSNQANFIHRSNQIGLFFDICQIKSNQIKTFFKSNQIKSNQEK